MVHTRAHQIAAVALSEVMEHAVSKILLQLGMNVEAGIPWGWMAKKEGRQIQPDLQVPSILGL